MLLHVTSLPSPYGIGDVGPAAMAWVDRLHEAGQSWWQALPLGPTGYGNSPYQSLSSFAGNGLLISPDWLIEDGLLRASDCQGHAFSATAVDYDAVIPFKHGLLETAWRNFSAGRRPDLQPAFDAVLPRPGALAGRLRPVPRPESQTDNGAITSSGRQSWCSASQPPWTRPGATWRTRSSRFAWHNSCCSVRGERLKAHARAKACA